MVLYALFFVFLYGFIKTEAFHGIQSALSNYEYSFHPGAGNGYFPIYFLMVDGSGGYATATSKSHNPGNQNLLNYPFFQDGPVKAACTQHCHDLTDTGARFSCYMGCSCDRLTDRDNVAFDGCTEFCIGDRWNEAITKSYFSGQRWSKITYYPYFSLVNPANTAYIMDTNTNTEDDLTFIVFNTNSGKSSTSFDASSCVAGCELRGVCVSPPTDAPTDAPTNAPTDAPDDATDEDTDGDTDGDEPVSFDGAFGASTYVDVSLYFCLLIVLFVQQEY